MTARTSRTRPSSLALSGAENASFALPEATGTIVDDDSAPVLSVQSALRVSEGAGSATFAATLSAPSAYEVTARYATRDVTATAGADYTATSGTLRIAPGGVSAAIAVPILEDEIAEGEETFVLLLSGVQNASLGNSRGTGTIADNESALSVSIGDVTVGEDAGSAVFTARLSYRSVAAVRIAYATSDETATAGLDYRSVSDTLQFDPGELEKEIVVPILQDVLEEGDETFLVELMWAENADVADGSGRATIVDDDEPVTISIYDDRAVEDAGSLLLPGAAEPGKRTRSECSFRERRRDGQSGSRLHGTPRGDGLRAGQHGRGGFDHGGGRCPLGGGRDVPGNAVAARECEDCPGHGHGYDCGQRRDAAAENWRHHGERGRGRGGLHGAAVGAECADGDRGLPHGGGHGGGRSGL